MKWRVRQNNIAREDQRPDFIRPLKIFFLNAFARDFCEKTGGVLNPNAEINLA